jgi:hypothetical protein
VLCKLAPRFHCPAAAGEILDDKAYLSWRCSHDEMDFAIGLGFIISLPKCANVLSTPDLHGNTLPTPHPPRLPSYFLRLVFERLV